MSSVPKSFKVCARALLIGLMLFSKTLAAWWDAGHMLIADIAYSRLSPSIKQAIDLRLSTMYHENVGKFRYDFDATQPNRTMMMVAHWPDDLGRYPNSLGLYKTWHYIEQPYTDDGTTLPSQVPRDNVVWAINTLTHHLKQPQANLASQGRALALLVHFVADIHQPLHCGSMYRRDLVKGDKGGNLIVVNYRFNNGVRVKNLHALWDSGINLFPQYGYSPNLRQLDKLHQLAEILTAKYPPSTFYRSLQVTQVKQWAQEGLVLSKKARIGITADGKISDDYLSKNTKVVEKQIVLAGYRLATLLNSIYIQP